MQTTVDFELDYLAISELEQNIQGMVLIKGHPEYEGARHLVNLAFDAFPGLIVRCQSSQDVVTAMNFARHYKLDIAVRSGGHSIAGLSTIDGGMMIDLSHMKAIVIDPEQRIAHVQPGATNGELVLAAQAYGLATTTGTCATVGMGGSTLGGGIGWLMGRFGASVDNVLAYEIVTADGEILNASPQSHPDLFWALGGGGGNFGVVTNISYQLHALEQVYGGMLVFQRAAAPLVLRMFQHLMATAPDELLAHAILTSIPEFGPAVIIQAVYSGENLQEGERLLAALRTFGPPAIDTMAVQRYADVYMMLTPPLPPGAKWHDAAYALSQPRDEALDSIIEIANTSPTPLSIIEFHPVHGAATRVAPDATAFALREPHFQVCHIAMWLEGDGAQERTWIHAGRSRMQPYAHPGVYVNFLSNEGEEAIRASYRSNYERLAWIKAAYDPTNLFQRTLNIKPA